MAVTARVCRIIVDPDRYQTFAPSSPAPEFAGDKLGSLGDLILTPVNPKAEPSAFYSLWIDGAFACSQAAGQALSPLLEVCGELLPARVVSGPGVLIFNCTNVVDCLDDERTTWKIGERSRERLWVLKYVFDPDRLPSDGQPFKLPQIPKTELFIVDDPDHRPDSSFISLVEKVGLIGLRLDPIAQLAPRAAPC